MKIVGNAVRMTGLICLILAVTSLAAQVQSTATAQAQQATPARAAKPQPATPPQAADSLTAPGVVAVSAACCKTTCADGPVHCGKQCTVVNSLSECAGENFHNIAFECPSDKGMVCVGSSCSCQ